MPDQPQLPHRRQVLRAAAWTAPVVLAAAPAPATAASLTTTGSLSFNYLYAGGAGYNASGRPTTIITGTSVQNVYTTGGPTLTSVTLTITIPATRVDGTTPAAVVGTGWTYSSSTQNGTTWVYTFTWTGTLAGGGSTNDLVTTFTLTNNSSGTFTLADAASGSNVSTANRSTTVTL